MGIRRGSTPKHTITVPFVVPTGAFLRVVYAQVDESADDGYRILFEKTEKDCVVTANGNSTNVVVSLTSADTLRFDCRARFSGGRIATPPVLVQIGVETATGKKVWSDEMQTTVERCLRKDGVIRNG